MTLSPNIRLLTFIFLALILVSFGGSSLLMAEQSKVDENEVRRISHKLRCPTCQALSVKESEAGLAKNMKMKIRNLLNEGKSEEEVLAFFVERYGEWILREPSKKGFNLLLWLMPGALILLSLAILLKALSSRKAKRAQVSATPLSKVEQAIIDKDLSNLQG